tara:strand:+ start:381 stop:662 length:282 start_codon:yes stop_codon:yes gene_type:complete
MADKKQRPRPKSASTFGGSLRPKMSSKDGPGPAEYSLADKNSKVSFGFGSTKREFAAVSKFDKRPDPGQYFKEEKNNKKGYSMAGRPTKDREL